MIRNHGYVPASIAPISNLNDPEVSIRWFEHKDRASKVRIWMDLGLLVGGSAEFAARPGTLGRQLVNAFRPCSFAKYSPEEGAAKA